MVPYAQEHLSQLLGPIRTLLADPAVSEIMVNGPQTIYYERHGQLHAHSDAFEDELALLSAIVGIAQHCGQLIDERHPILEGRLATGTRVQAVIPPAAPTGPVLTLRRGAGERMDLDAWVAQGSVSVPAAAFLRARVRGGCNVLIAGGTGSGKTSLLSALSGCVPDRQRIVVIEDTRELDLPLPHVVYLQACGTTARRGARASIRELLRATLRLRPDRIVIGEIRGAEALELVQAMTSGHGGGLSSIHASHPRDALGRLETCCLMSDVPLGLAALRPQIASAIEFIVQTVRTAEGQRRVTHISEVTGLRDGGYQLIDHFGLDPHGELTAQTAACARAEVAS